MHHGWSEGRRGPSSEAHRMGWLVSVWSPLVLAVAPPLEFLCVRPWRCLLSINIITHLCDSVYMSTVKMPCLLMQSAQNCIYCRISEASGELLPLRTSCRLYWTFVVVICRCLCHKWVSNSCVVLVCLSAALMLILHCIKAAKWSRSIKFNRCL